MIDIRMYCTAFCPYCVRAEMLLKSKGISEITKIMVDSAPDGFSDMVELTGRLKSRWDRLDPTRPGGGALPDSPVTTGSTGGISV